MLAAAMNMQKMPESGPNRIHVIRQSLGGGGIYVASDFPKASAWSGATADKTRQNGASCRVLAFHEPARAE